MKDALTKALWTPSIMAVPGMILGALVVIVVILVLGSRSGNLSHLDAKLDRVIRVQEDIRTKVQANDRSIRVLEAEK